MVELIYSVNVVRAMNGAGNAVKSGYDSTSNFISFDFRFGGGDQLLELALDPSAIFRT